MEEQKIPSVADVQLAARQQSEVVNKIVSKFTPGFVISDIRSAEEVAQDIKIIKTTLDNIDTIRKKFTRPLDEQKKFFMDLFRPAETELKAVEHMAKGSLLAFQQEERRKAEEEAAVLRKEQEAARRAEEERLRREKEKAAAAEDEEAVAAVEQQIEQTKATPVVAAPPTEAPKFGGISTQKLWKARVTDITALMKHILETGSYGNLVIVDTSELGKFARATKGTVPLPGIEFYSEESMSARTK